MPDLQTGHAATAGVSAGSNGAPPRRLAANAPNAPPAPPAPPAPLVKVRVWDLPTRLFHWALVLVMTGSVVSAKIGGAAMVWHFRLGYAMFALLAFRLLWGVVGGRWSRFGSFIYGPTALLRYVGGRSRPDEHHHVGHSPLGALSVFALLALLLVQVGTGLVADDELGNVGPLSLLVSSQTTVTATSWHRSWGQWLLLGLVALHLLAVLVYLWVKRHNLIGPMWRGDKALVAMAPAVPASADSGRHRLLALLLLLACVALVTWVVQRGSAAGAG